MNNNIKKFIKNQLNNQIKEYDFSINNIEKIIKYFDMYKNMILLFIIYNNNLYIFFKDGDSRKNIIINIVKKYFEDKKNKNNLKNTLFPFFISDAYFYYNNEIPFLIESKPINKKGILIPPTSFYKIKIGENLNDISYNQFIDILDEKKCFNYDKKKPIIFFKGANTGSDKHNIRMKLKDIVEENNDKRYMISIADKFIPMYEFCQYKYLLNLPGHQPWSYRLMKILTMGSLIIDIKVRQSYNDGRTFNEKWIMIYEEYFKKDIDFIQIDYDWILDRTRNNQVYEIYKKINEIYEYYQKNENQFKKIVNSCKKKADILNMNTFNSTYDLILDGITDELYKKNKDEDINTFLEKIINNYII